MGRSIHIARLTSFRPKYEGANSIERTLPFASVRTARSIHFEDWAVLVLRLLSCHILTVRSKELEATREPCSGCAHEILVMGAS